MNEIEYLESVVEQLNVNIDLRSSNNELMAFANDKHSIVVNKENNEIVNNSITKEYDPKISKADEQDCEIALASGLLTGSLGSLFSKKFDLKDVSLDGKEDINNLVLKIAKMDMSRNGKDTKNVDLYKAISYLEKNYKLSSDRLTSEFGEGLQHHLRDFSHHPSLIGFIFSIATQFTGYGFGTNTEGKFIYLKVPENFYIGKTTREKLFNATFSWAMHLVSDMAGSSNNPGNGTGIPGPILSLIKEISSIPGVNSILIQCKDSKISPSVLASKMFNGTLFKDDNGKPIRFDFRTELGIFKWNIKNSWSVMANEIIVRTFYFIKHLASEIEAKNIVSIHDIEKLNAKNFLPFDSRSLTRMITVSSLSYVVANGSMALAKSFIEAGGNVEASKALFVANINYTGLLKLTIAIKADREYLIEDAKDVYINYINDLITARETFKYFNLLSLDHSKAKLLYSIENKLLVNDINNTLIGKSRKNEFYNNWKLSYGNNSNECFYNESEIINKITGLDSRDEKNRWLYLLILELLSFDKIKSKDCVNYLVTKFDSQSNISKEDIVNFKNKYEYYLTKFRNNNYKHLDLVVDSYKPKYNDMYELLIYSVSASLTFLYDFSNNKKRNWFYVYLFREYAKLVAYCDYVLINKYEDTIAVRKIYRLNISITAYLAQYRMMIRRTEKNTKVLEQYDEAVDLSNKASDILLDLITREEKVLELINKHKDKNA